MLSSEVYNERPKKIVERLTKILKPLGYTFGYNNRGFLFCIKKGNQSKPYPYFYKDRRGRIHMRLRLNRDDIWDKCIDKETNEWLAYYVYKEIIKR